MKNILYFSDYIKPFLQRIKSIFIIIGRFFKILFRRKKGIEILEFSYAKKYLFDKSFLIIHYQFRNALWYNFKNIKQTTENEIIILNLKNIPEMPIELVVYGFFRKKIFPVFIATENVLESELFKAEIKEVANVKKLIKPLILNAPKFITTIPKVNLKYPNTQIKHPSFSQTDFI